MHLIQKNIVALLLAFTFVPVMAQINGTNAYLAEQAAYGSDLLYFYSNASLAQLDATAPGTAPATFTWSTHSQSGWQSIKSESGMNSSLTGINAGLYRLVINDGATTQTHQCWVMVPTINNVAIALERSSCERVILSGTCDFEPLNYYDPANGTTYQVSYQPSYQWHMGDETLAVTDVATAELQAPYDDTEYGLKVSTRLLNTAASSASPVAVKAIAVKAAFTYTNTKDKAENELHTDTEGSAPMRLLFKASPDGTTDRSQGHINNYSWEFGEAGKDFTADPTFVFQEAGTFPVILTVESRDEKDNLLCSSTSEPVNIIVKEAFVEVPNVFTPNGDGQNDEFRVAYRSIKSFSMIIVNRWGRVVYESTNPDEGWDGKIGKQDAAPGVYFYDVKATGYNKDESFHRKGFLHLLVGKQ